MKDLSYRKKAMDMMAKEKPSLKIEKKVMMSEDVPPKMEEEKGELISMMVTPEEKQMIMQMRQKESGESKEGEIDFMKKKPVAESEGY